MTLLSSVFKKKRKKAQYFSVSHLTDILHRHKTTCLDQKVDVKGLITLLCPKHDKSSAQLLSESLHFFFNHY